MKPRLIHRPALCFVGLRITTRPMAPEIPALWRQFGPYMFTIPAQAEPRVSYGVMDNFDPVQDRLDYMAGVTVTQASPLPDGLVAWTVPEQQYAVFETPLAAIGAAFAHIFDTWLPGSAYEQAAGPYFERYGETFEPEDPQSVLEIQIPITARRP